MFGLSQLDYVLGKRGGGDRPSHCEGRSGSLMSDRACHAQRHTGLSLLCPVLFLGMAVKVGWTNIYMLFMSYVLLLSATFPTDERHNNKWDYESTFHASSTTHNGQAHPLT